MGRQWLWLAFQMTTLHKSRMPLARKKAGKGPTEKKSQSSAKNKEKVL